jgi:RNA polymerase sigma-70 factor (ECF subfamily)
MDAPVGGSYEPDVGKFRKRLQVLAEALLPRKLQARFDSSDVVQETLLKAHDKVTQFRGVSDGELFAWLQKILRSVCVDKARQHTAGKREAGLEISLQQTFDQSFDRLEKLLAADSSSPSTAVGKTELVMKALDALGTLSDKEREVVVAYYLHGMTMQETADSLEMSKSDVARTIERALTAMRGVFKHELAN